MHVPPFSITAEDVASDPPAKRKQVTIAKKPPRFQALNEDAIWIIETDIARTRKALETREGPLTDKEHSRMMKSVEQMRKLRLTDAELNKMQDPDNLDDAALSEEFEERCKLHGLDPDAVRKVFGL